MQDVAAAAAAAATKADVQITGAEKPCQKKRCGGALGEMVQEAIAWDFASLSSTFVRDDLIKDYEGKREREGETGQLCKRLSLTDGEERLCVREGKGRLHISWLA